MILFHIVNLWFLLSSYRSQQSFLLHVPVQMKPSVLLVRSIYEINWKLAFINYYLSSWHWHHFAVQGTKQMRSPSLSRHCFGSMHAPSCTCSTFTQYKSQQTPALAAQNPYGMLHLSLSLFELDSGGTECLKPWFHAEAFVQMVCIPLDYLGSWSYPATSSLPSSPYSHLGVTAPHTFSVTTFTLPQNIGGPWSSFSHTANEAELCPFSVQATQRPSWSQTGVDMWWVMVWAGVGISWIWVRGLGVCGKLFFLFYFDLGLEWKLFLMCSITNH